ncbi:MAG: type II secretion system major pseudopilin GspG [Phycisphaerales bacterium]|nr:type II secretion system major pseudopilin GspG [Phycisphaerales bacterium]
MEAIVIIVILGVLAAIIAPRFLGRIGQSKEAVAMTNMKSLAQAVNLFRADCGELKEGMSLDILLTCPADVAQDKWKGPYINNADQLRDPWGNPYVLVFPGDRNKADFDIVSYGSDGRPGGEGENKDLVAP